MPKFRLERNIRFRKADDQDRIGQRSHAPRHPMRGTSIRLSPMRRFVCDLLHAARQAPTVPVQRRMQLRSVVLARSAHPGRLPWSAIFIKAFAKVANEMPELRRAYVK